MDSVIVDEDVKSVIRECFDLGPLHNPANLIGIEAVEKAMPGKKNVAVWDTAFGGSMEPKAYLYAIPREYYERYHIRRYGFHGTSHMFVSNETLKFAGLDQNNGKVIVCHLGNGASISASVGGKCVGTSMGLTPLEGLIMGTRSGDIDPAIVEFICNHENISVSEMLNILNKKSGLLGMSGISSDMRDVIAEYNNGNQIAKDTLAAYVYRIAKYIGSYVTSLNGVDAITFTAGVGENNPFIRSLILDYFEYLGVKIDKAANEGAIGSAAIISTPDSKVKVCVIPTNEELAIARETLRLTK
jgi:acetate kinase